MREILHQWNAIIHTSQRTRGSWEGTADPSIFFTTANHPLHTFQLPVYDWPCCVPSGLYQFYPSLSFLCLTCSARIGYMNSNLPATCSHKTHQRTITSIHPAEDVSFYRDIEFVKDRVILHELSDTVQNRACSFYPLFNANCTKFYLAPPFLKFWTFPQLSILFSAKFTLWRNAFYIVLFIPCQAKRNTVLLSPQANPVEDSSIISKKTKKLTEAQNCFFFIEQSIPAYKSTIHMWLVYLFMRQRSYII